MVNMKLLRILLVIALACSSAAAACGGSHAPGTPAADAGGQPGGGGGGDDGGDDGGGDDGADSSSTPRACDPSYREQIRRAGDYLVRIQNAEGAIPDAWDSAWFNMDNNMGYALLGLSHAYAATGDAAYRAALGRALEWSARPDVQDADGAWHWGYRRTADGSYAASVTDDHRRQGISDIRSIDTVQAFFALNLWLYSLAGGDPATVQALLPAARRGIDRLLASNFDGRRFFFSSEHQDAAGRWALSKEKYAMDQGDVYLGLKGICALTGERDYCLRAEALRDAFDASFWDGGNARYAVGLNELDEPSDGEYILAQSVPTFFLRNPSAIARHALDYLIARRTPAGWIDPDDADNRDGATIDVAGMALAAGTLGDEEVSQQAKEYLASQQVASAAEADGAFRYRIDTDERSHLYTNVTAFAIMALCGDILP